MVGSRLWPSAPAFTTEVAALEVLLVEARAGSWSTRPFFCRAHLPDNALQGFQAREEMIW